MKKRYFYDCPIKAAFMVRYHGLKIHGPVKKPTGEIDTSARPMPVWILARAIEAAEKGMAPEDARYYIAEESVKLLEAGVGDVLRLYFYSPEEDDKHGAVMTGFYAGGRETITWFRDPKDGGIEKQLHKIDEHRWRVLQRHGLAFIWPESEEA